MIRKPIYNLLFLLLLFAPMQSWAQLDSIASLLENAKLDNKQLFNEINTANQYISTSPKKALDHLEKALQLSFQYQNKRGEAYTYYSLGAVNYRLGQNPDAVNYFKKAQTLFVTLGDSSSSYHVLRYLGSAQEANGDYNGAKSSYLKYLKMAQKKANKNDELAVRSNLARLYFNNKKYQLALQENLFLLNNNFKNTFEVYENLGKCYSWLKDTTNAIKYFKLSDNRNPTRKGSGWSARYYENVSQSYNSVQSYDKAIMFQKKAKSKNKKNNNLKALNTNNQIIANTFLYDARALSAIPYITESIDLSNQLGQLQESGEGYRQLSEAYEQMGKTEEARKSFEKYKEINLKVFEEKEKKLKEQLTDLSGYFEKEKQIALLVKEKELNTERIQLLEQKQKIDSDNLRIQKKINQEQKTINYFLITVLLLLCAGILFMIRSSRQKKLANQMLAIRSLRSQMNPHFIFNSLNSVNSFISKSDNKSANKYLTEFAKLMRLVLKHSQKDFVSLEAELEVIERYLKLEHLRFSDQFEYKLNVDLDDFNSDLFIPPMLIQPYIENAIWHGLRYKKDKGFLLVEVKQYDDVLKFVIEDDGIGRDASQKLKTEDQKSRESTGMSNTQNRIKILNNVNRSDIEVRLTDKNIDLGLEQDCGTRVELIVPLKDMLEESHAQLK